MLKPASSDVEAASLDKGRRPSEPNPASAASSGPQYGEPDAQRQSLTTALRWALDLVLVLAILYFVWRTSLLGMLADLFRARSSDSQVDTMAADLVQPGKLSDLNLRVYVAELPSRYVHKAFDKFMKRPGGPGISHEQGFAAPLGPRYIQQADQQQRGGGGFPFEDPDFSELYDTDQYANDVWWYTQLMASPLRVERYEDADIVFVPGLFARADPGVEEERQYSIAWWDFLNEYMPYLPNVTDKPHVLGFPRVVWPHLHDFRAMPSLAPFTVTALEPFTGKAGTFTRINDRIVVIPYQAHVHYSRGRFPRPWDPQAVAASKQLLASSSFRSRKDLRKQLAEQCAARPGQCSHHEYKPDDPEDFLPSWQVAAQSWYCFQPPGDTPSRRSLYDCLLAGAIPVIFDYTLLDAMPFADIIPWWQMLVTMSKDAVEGRGDSQGAGQQQQQQTGKANAIDVLARQHNQTDALGRLKELHSIKHLVQYSINPAHELIRFDSMWSHLPEDDAFTASWKSILRRLCNQEKLPAIRCCSSHEFAARHPDRCATLNPNP